MTDFFAAAVYVLCFLTSMACAGLLARSFTHTRARLLLWSATCFGLLAANNLMLVLDLVVWPDFNLRLARTLLSLAAVLSLVWGFVWEPEDR
jgi:hypothetical protein